MVGYALAAFNRELSTIPGQMALAEKAHVRIRALRNSLHRLVNAGHLKITQTKSGAVRSRYTFVLFPPVRGIVKDGKPVEQ